MGIIGHFSIRCPLFYFGRNFKWEIYKERGRERGERERERRKRKRERESVRESVREREE